MDTIKNSPSVHQKLNEATRGLLQELTVTCRTKNLRPYVMVQTHYEGLKNGEMRLVAIGIDGDGCTKYFETARLPRDAQKDGWELKARMALLEAN